LSLAFASCSSPYLLSWRGYLARLVSKRRWTGGVPSTEKKVYIKIFRMAKFGGRYLNAEGKQFFRSVTLNGRKCAPDGELQIGVALAMDWCV
jgi:hypothetical protein